MDRPEYFQTALSNFATDVACGGAIRHLTDLGYTLEQIVARLDYPTHRSKAQRIMMEHLYEKRVLLLQEPSPAVFEQQAQFVEEQDAYGRRTFRKIGIDYDSQRKMTDTTDLTMLSQAGEEAKMQTFLWRESTYDRKRDGKLTELLHKKCEQNGESLCYVSCAFDFLNIDLNSQNQQQQGEKSKEEDISCLNSRQREYLDGIRWEKPVVYHRLDQRMREIIGKLYEAEAYNGACFFIRTREKLCLQSSRAL
ncbi:MAG: hypothetical protein HDR07_02615 [Lachnospiraceae bacterium]|nr:hypothetical protein [Lachnospiraceae bacterium]